MTIRIPELQILVGRAQETGRIQSIANNQEQRDQQHLQAQLIQDDRHHQNQVAQIKHESENRISSREKKKRDNSSKQKKKKQKQEPGKGDAIDITI